MTLPAGDHADAVVVVNGTGTILGDATSVVVVNGTLSVQGATVESIVAVRSPVTLGPGSVVTKDVTTFDSVVTKTGDAVVQGEVRDVGVKLAGVGFVLGPLDVPGLVGFALAAIAAGLLLAALGARQVRAAEGIIRHEPGRPSWSGSAACSFRSYGHPAVPDDRRGSPRARHVVRALAARRLVGYLVAGIAIGDWVSASDPDGHPGTPVPGVGRRADVLAARDLPIPDRHRQLVGFGAVLMLGGGRSATRRRRDADRPPSQHPCPPSSRRPGGSQRAIDPRLPRRGSIRVRQLPPRALARRVTVVRSDLAGPRVARNRGRVTRPEADAGRPSGCQLAQTCPPSTAIRRSVSRRPRASWAVVVAIDPTETPSR